MHNWYFRNIISSTNQIIWSYHPISTSFCLQIGLSFHFTSRPSFRCYPLPGSSDEPKFSVRVLILLSRSSWYLYESIHFIALLIFRVDFSDGFRKDCFSTILYAFELLFFPCLIEFYISFHGSNFEMIIIGDFARLISSDDWHRDVKSTIPGVLLAVAGDIQFQNFRIIIIIIPADRPKKIPSPIFTWQ